MDLEPIDPLPVVQATKLPYTVPVDVVVRCVQVILLLFGLYTIYACAIAKTTGAGGWACSVIFLVFAGYLQFRPSGLFFDDLAVHHRSLFLKVRSIPWEGIMTVTTGIQNFNIKTVPIKGSLGEVDPTMGPYLMIFTRKDGKPPFLINIKPYSMRGLATFVHFIVHKAQGAVIDDATRKITQGIVPSAFFGEQKGHG